MNKNIQILAIVFLMIVQSLIVSRQPDNPVINWIPPSPNVNALISKSQAEVVPQVRALCKGISKYLVLTSLSIDMSVSCYSVKRTLKNSLTDLYSRLSNQNKLNKCIDSLS